MSGSGQRAFAQKLNKQGNAAEVRKQISSTIFNDLPRSVSGVNLTELTGSVDVAEPPDFEEFVVQNQTLVDRDPYRDRLLYPDDDDIEVLSLPKRCRTVTHIVPEIGGEVDPHVFDCVRRYTADYTIVSRRYQQYTHNRNIDRECLVQQEYEVDIDDVCEQDKDLPNKRQSIHMSETPRGSWASSIFDLKQSQADAQLPNLFDRVSQEEVDRNNEIQRQQHRQDTVFTLYPPQDEEEQIEKRAFVMAPTEHFGHRILVKCLQLKLELEVEPIFATMAVYDAKERKKISENFYFDLNGDNFKQMIRFHVPHQDLSTTSKAGVFSITYPSPDVFLVIRLEKVLQQGDISECADPYIKEEKSKEDKYRSNAAQFCERLGKYRMPFAWTAIYLMNIVNGAHSYERETSVDSIRSESEMTRAASLDRRSGMQPGQYDSFRKRPKDDILASRSYSTERGRSGYEKRRSWSPDDYGGNLSNFRPVTLTVSSFFKQEGDKLSDEDLYKYLIDIKRPSNVLKRVKCIPGTLKLDISPCPEEPKQVLTADLWKVEPYPEDKNKPIKEILEFPTHEVFSMATTYRNLLYVYPRSLNFANRQGSARNIAVKIQLMHGEEESGALQAIFGKSNCPELSREAYTSVTYHNKSPDFYEEVKIRLPAHLTDAHHLLFTFYHISCQTKKGEPASAVETPVGFTWLPLMRDGRLHVGDFMLPVSVEKLPPSYSILFPDIHTLPGMKWVDNHKGVFSVQLQSVSTIHTQDDKIDKFLSMCRLAQEQKLPPRKNESQFESELKHSLSDLIRARGENLVQFLSLILDKLILLMIRPPTLSGQVVNTGQPAFDAMAQIVQRVRDMLEDKNDSNGRNSVLAAYIQYCCTLPHPGGAMPGQMEMSSGYATLGRPSSLPINKQAYQRSTSNPDLTTPTTPEAEMAGFFSNRAGSMRTEEFAHAFGKSRRKLVHEEFALQWVVLSGSTRETALSNSWFFFEIMIKSMAEHLSKTDSLCAPRQMRFPPQFIDDVQSLVYMLIKDIVDRYVRDPPMIRSLNTSLAFFLQDLLSYMDRGFVFQLVKQYTYEVNLKIKSLTDATSLRLLHLDFLRIICAHEHYFTLNLPFGTPLTPSANSSSPTPSIASITSQDSQSSYTSTSTITNKGVFYDLTPEFQSQHYLTGLVLKDLSLALDTNNPTLHHKAINVVGNLLQNHDLDVRYTDLEMKARLAALYLPLVGITIKALPQVYDPNMEGRYRTDEEMDTINQRVALAIAGQNLFSKYSEPSQSHGDISAKIRKCQLNAEDTRNLLICFTWVLKNVDKSVLRQWWSDMKIDRLNCILEIIYYAISNFEYRAKWSNINMTIMPPHLSDSQETLEDWKESPTSTLSRLKSASLPKSLSKSDLWEGIQRKSQDFLKGTGMLYRSNSKDDSPNQGKKSMAQFSQQTMKKSVDMKSRLEEAILGGANARAEMMRRRQSANMSLSGDRTPPAVGQSPLAAMEGGKLRWRKEQVQWRHSHEPFDSPKPRDVEADAHIEGNLAAEVSMVALDTLELIIQIAQASEMMQPLLSSALRVLLHGLGLNQSTFVLQHMFSSQRSLVTKFLDLLFEEETEQCADLCLRLLRHCSSCIGNTRAQASASLYMLMRQNFELGNNFSRVKMQVTMSLSSLVGQNQDFNEEYLRKSLKTILTYAEADTELQETTFPDQVKDLVFNLHMILSDTVKMKEFQEDPEMLLDLMYRIAKGYQTSPDLRLTWLQNMATKHSERGNHAEAAHCLVHAAGLISEYLNMLEDKTYLPVGCVEFQRITPNVLEESAVSDDIVSPDEEGICTGMYFTENGLVGLLEQAASCFTMAGMYEALSKVYRVLIPIHEHNRDFKKLAHLHGKLQESFNQVIKQEGKRMFGTYFRVGFYGHKFGDLDGEEFVYKEPAITKLPEISHRLESFYGDRFGHDVISMIKDSNTVEREKLDQNKAFIQITYVEPYFDSYELRDRVTYYEKNINIKRFMYATPFTLDGRAHGELQEQYKRKTILTTNHFFPYVKTRLSVINREQVILSPIEVAIEDIMKKTKELAIALRQDPPDTKMLQMVMQGCLGTTVNQGPVEVANVFLKEVAEGKQVGMKHHNKLRLCFKDFLKKCCDALHRNKSLITHEQKEYQRELERNYHVIKGKLLPWISNAATLKRTKHHRREGKESRKHHQVASTTQSSSQV
ncbi:dedicator of cytokinesis protein 7-like isoform X2 [Ruditapes philippinarum]|uniref:dedicator of cytokinesis protein 7-like isoform X2 n=1 Tax=Ruditapes philippinarum TaxID=129788 RepID=UPI00295A926A|nr:dedicator of cytokinesis protein 7-like isoform X2 [Ruditapes philippinarum]